VRKNNIILYPLVNQNNTVQLKTPKQTELLLLAVGFVSLILLIFFKNKHQCNDEIPYLTNISLLHTYGLGKEFLVRLEGSAGPLYSVVHYLFEPITNLQPPGIRLVNVLFLGGTIFFLALILKRVNTVHWTFAFFILAIPKMYVLTGLAFTEMPAIFFYTAAIFCLLKAADAKSPFSTRMINSLIGGLCISLAILGRQPFLLSLIAVPVLFLKDWSKRSWLLLAVIAIAALVLPVYVLMQWNGWMPPGDRQYYPDVEGQLNLRPDFLILCLFYVAAAFIIIAPRFFKIRNRKELLFVAIAAGIAGILNFLFNFVSYLPVVNVLGKMPVDLIEPASLFFGWIFICVSFYFLYKLFQTLIVNRDNLPLMFFIASLVLICFASMRITWGFSSRYSMHVAPLIILVASLYYKSYRFNLVLIAAGIVIGLFSLYSYYG
jgi:4-amino-4-deoxy-L-arabinose transferase-like glycosyltransferase